MIFQSYNKIGHLASRAGYSSSKSSVVGLVVLFLSSEQVKPIMHQYLFSLAL